MTMSPGFTPSRLTTATMPPITIGHWARPAFFQLLGLQWRVGCAECYGSRLDLLDARARSNRLIVQSIPRVFLVRISPFCIDGKWKGRSSAGNIGSLRDSHRCGAYGERNHSNEISQCH